MVQSAQKRLELEKDTEEQQLELKREAETARFKADQDLAAIETERKVTKAQGEIERLRAESDAAKKIIDARADAAAAIALAHAHAEDRKAETAGVTPMEVMLHAYDALAQLGGTGTTILLGDWAHVPSFLFPRVPSLQSAFTLPWGSYGGAQRPVSPATVAPETP
jgi:hypothetical protein